MTRQSPADHLRIFRSDILERLSRNSPVALLVFWLPTAVLALGVCLVNRPHALPLVGLTIITILAWSLFEYCMHRFAFHAQFSGRSGRRLTFIIHGNHHVDPGDPMRNVMPLSITIPVGIVLYGIDRLMFAPATGAWIAGIFILSYVFYDVLHWRTHQVRGSTRLERYLRRYHLRHHYGPETGNFGVSSPLWDVVFGTTGKRRRANTAMPSRSD